MKSLEERIEEITQKHGQNKQNFLEEVHFPKEKMTAYTICWSNGIERLDEAFSIIQELQNENKKLKQTQDNLVKDLTSCWDRQEACRVKDEKRCEELDEIGKLFEKFKKENESLKKCYEITNLSWKDLYKENIELKEQLKIK